MKAGIAKFSANQTPTIFKINIMAVQWFDISDHMQRLARYARAAHNWFA
jgi:hypothetical protein